MKKIVCMVLVVILSAISLCACGGGDDGGNAKLYWAMQWSYQKDYDTVLKAVNEELEKHMPGTQIEFQMDMAYETKWALWMAGKTQIDLCVSGWPLSLAEDIQNGCLMPLDDLVKEYAPSVQAEMEEYASVYQTGTVNDKLYAIPNIQFNIDDDLYFGVPEAYYQFIDPNEVFAYAEQNPTCTEEFYQIIDRYADKVAAHITSTGSDQKPYIDMQYFQQNVVRRGFDFISRDSDFCYRIFDKDGNVNQDIDIIDIHDTEEYKTFIKWANTWYKKGYISKDIITSSSSSATDFIFYVNVASFSQNDTNNDGIIEPRVGNNYADMYMIKMTPDKWKINGINLIGKWSTYFSIPTTAKYPERAMQLIELLRTDEGADLLNLIIYGIEGTHYDELEDGTIRAKDYVGQGTSGSAYGIPYWMISSSVASNKKIIYPYTKEYVAKAADYYANVGNLKTTPLTGFTFDTSEISTELTMLKAVNEEYEKQLTAGISDDYMAIYNEFMDKRKASKSEEIIKQLQNQADKK